MIVEIREIARFTRATPGSSLVSNKSFLYKCHGRQAFLIAVQLEIRLKAAQKNRSAAEPERMD